MCFSSGLEGFEIFNRIVLLNGLREISFFSADVTSPSKMSVCSSSLESEYSKTCRPGTILISRCARVSISGQQERERRRLDLYFARSPWTSRWVYVASLFCVCYSALKLPVTDRWASGGHARQITAAEQGCKRPNWVTDQGNTPPSNPARLSNPHVSCRRWVATSHAGVHA